MSTAAHEQQQQQQQNTKMSNTSGTYDVARPHGKCAVTGNTIEPGEKFMAALRETPVAFDRIDVSLQAWPQFDRTGVLGFWQTVMPRPEQKKKVFVDDQVLCELFERLGDATEPNKLNFRFVLGLILMRKRMLVYETSRTEHNREIWSMRFKGREEKLDLVNPKLDESQVQEVSQQLGDILNEEV
jgi:hypothetical protein